MTRPVRAEPLRCFVDVETTGLDAGRDVIIEMGWVCVQGDCIVERGGSLVNTKQPIPAAVAALTGITSATLQRAPTLPAVLARLHAVLQRCSMVGAYAAPFDRGFLDAAARQHALQLPNRPWVDVLALARQRRPGLPRHRLADVAAALDVHVDGPLHRAVADAALCAQVWLALTKPSRRRDQDDDDSPLLRLFQ